MVGEGGEARLLYDGDGGKSFACTYNARPSRPQPKLTATAPTAAVAVRYRA